MLQQKQSPVTLKLNHTNSQAEKQHNNDPKYHLSMYVLQNIFVLDVWGKTGGWSDINLRTNELNK